MRPEVAISTGSRHGIVLNARGDALVTIGWKPHSPMEAIADGGTDGNAVEE
jgi:hypothetical protein